LAALLIFTVSAESSRPPEAEGRIALGRLEIASSAYGLHGKTPCIAVELENIAAEPVGELSLDLEVNGETVYAGIPLGGLPRGSTTLRIPWAPPRGVADYELVLRIKYRSRSGEAAVTEAGRVFEDLEIRYDDVYTHPWITRRANDFLQAKYPGGEYAELDLYIDAVAEGSIHEDALGADNDGDDSSERFYRHFYRPTDFLGLQEVPGYPPNIFDCVTNLENSLDWGDGSTAYNEYDWQDALAHYAGGDLWNAYYALGHVAHLIEDLSVPAHTHLDIHAVSLAEEYGDDYEDYCEGLISGGGSLPLPDPGESMIVFEDLASFWNNPGAVFPLNGMARLSYYRNRFPCDLSDEDNPQGVFKDMYPALEYIYDFWAFEYQWDIDSPDLGNWDYSFGSSCPLDYSGSMGDDEWWSVAANYGNPDDADEYYVENTEYVAQIRKSSWDPENSANDTYAANTSGLSQMELLAEDLIPLCIRYVAGLMAFFHDTVNPPPPDPPGGLSITLSEGWITLEWEAVEGADSYRVYSSTNPYGGFAEDLSGIFDGTYWTAPVGAAAFFRVTSVAGE